MSNSVFNGGRCETVCCSRPLATDLHSSAVCVCVCVCVCHLESSYFNTERVRAVQSCLCLWLITAGVDMAAINIIKIITLTSIPSRSFPARKDPCLCESIRERCLSPSPHQKHDAWLCNRADGVMERSSWCNTCVFKCDTVSFPPHAPPQMCNFVILSS